MDVARKVVILARTCGLDVTLDTLHVRSLVPQPLGGEGVDREEYLRRLPEVRESCDVGVIIHVLLH